MSAPAVAVRERPILLSGPMVRAVLDGRKTQTRRVVSDSTSVGNYRASELLLDAPDVFVDGGPSPAGNAGPYLHAPVNCEAICRRRGWDDGECDPAVVERLYPRVGTGDRLWVRETFHACPHCACPDYYPQGRPAYRADGEGVALSRKCLAHGRWRPSIHMPRWASRLTLEITGVRVERVQAITPADAEAEGALHKPPNWPIIPEAGRDQQRISDFRRLWDSLNAARGSGWDANPWVWVIEFRRVDA